ncbi:TlpA disulfide reductase family protein [Flammeovirga sp. SJP92]|uniref:TlpA family protein disulfide reductase n=1 Tax=Flammeovirga sp. SJP92 TaxID=1775430 RepID=UPI000788F0DB|nr:TlpA disulfide reductase family protein [Flammeovirga sp. SJP92]KXX71681.1 hypothetical protein AVL50_05250 [Flammeovirga sp. SJP92]
MAKTTNQILTLVALLLLGCQQQEGLKIINSTGQPLILKSFKGKIVDHDTFQIQQQTRTIALEAPQFFMVEMEEQFFPLYLSPHTEVELSIDKDGLIYQGDGSYFNNALLESRRIDPCDYNYETGLTKAQYLSYRDSLEQQLNEIPTGRFSKIEKQIWKDELQSYRLMSKFYRLFVNGLLLLQENCSDDLEDDVLKQIFQLHQHLETGSGIYSGMTLDLMNAYWNTKNVDESHYPHLPDNLKERLLALKINNIIPSGKKFNVLDSTLTAFKKQYPNSVYSTEIENNYKDIMVFKKGKKAKDIVAYNAEGDAVQLLAQEKDLLIIKVWATWCKPCIEELNEFQSLEEKYSDIPFVKVSIDHDREKWSSFGKIKRTENSYIIPRNSDNSFFEDYKIEGAGRYIIIGKDNRFINAFAELHDLEKAILNRL